MTVQPVVSCQDLRFSAGGYEVLRGVDLDVRPGTIVALLGTNGAGKTTTMELLLGQRRPGGGTVRVLGRDPHRERRPLAADLGVVLQEGGCAPDLTVAETVRLWARLHGRREAGALLEELDLRHRAAVRVRHLSGGERRRLDLAVALCGAPKLLLLDEPTSGLDPQSRERTWAVLRDRRRAGLTVLLTTHYLEEAEALADDIAIMHAGRVAAAGPLTGIRATETLADMFHRIAGGADEVGPGMSRAAGDRRAGGAEEAGPGMSRAAGDRRAGGAEAAGPGMSRAAEHRTAGGIEEPGAGTPSGMGNDIREGLR